MSLNPIFFILIGLILLAGLIWQGLLFRADVQKGYSGRLVLPFYLSLFLPLGVIAYALLISLDVYQGFDQEKFTSLLSWVGLLILGFALKAYFGPILLAVLTMVLLYNYAQGYVPAYRAYLNVCSLCLKREAAELALLGVEEQGQWQSIAASKNRQDFQNYLNTCRACTFRQLAFASCVRLPSQSSFTGEELPIFLDNLGCTGNESNLLDCPHNGWGTHNCNKTEAVFLLPCS